ncbi:MAG: transposase [Candidatus Sericytochromatia bacterium]
MSIDDTVLDKPYTNINSNNLISIFYSGKHHKTVKGINLITLYCTDTKGVSLPVNFRMYRKEDKKTKNEYFREMVLEVLNWGLRPELVTGDSWYASIENLKFLRKHELSFLFGIEKDRIISTQKGFYQQVLSGL